MYPSNRLPVVWVVGGSQGRMQAAFKVPHKRTALPRLSDDRRRAGRVSHFVSYLDAVLRAGVKVAVMPPSD